INALDSCMQDDFVCGSDYENCLDPTGKYIVNGEIVVGSMPVAPTDAEISNYLRTKIGKLDNRGRPQGACAAVMQKCHNSVMKNDKYDTNNPLITEYLARTVPRIQVLRANAIRAYGVSCVANVAACINQNGYGTSQNAAIQACMAHIKTCRSLTDSNTGTNLSDIRTWLATVMGPTNTTPDSPDIGDETNMRERDIANCLSIPNARISTSGKLCVVWDADTNRTLTQKMINLAQQHGGQYYPGMPQSQSSYTGKQISGNAYAYIMRWAYLDALNECTQRDGTLTIPQGNAHIYCNIEFPVGKMTKTECDAMLTVWPGNGTFGGFNDSAVTVNGHVTKQSCRYTPAGFYYTGRDLPGTCLPGMTERNDNTGNCTCMPGYHYVTGFACEPDDGL
ncbi:MAG: hypothetical protein K2L95_03340, partial [Alphaproteobacteria bacterium]|nr:hypothetical protein [Alphaproteobacteria bacterium]